MELTQDELLSALSHLKGGSEHPSAWDCTGLSMPPLLTFCVLLHFPRKGEFRQTLATLPSLGLQPELRTSQNEPCHENRYPKIISYLPKLPQEKQWNRQAWKRFFRIKLQKAFPTVEGVRRGTEGGDVHLESLLSHTFSKSCRRNTHFSGF